ncbi:spermidine synthase [Sorangium sp. So ce1151]|uniref:spermidine synthase n=1 Tax=Sorangium sp. So ce1151 TaxID=3133332 RepID=UPI003F5EB846
MTGWPHMHVEMVGPGRTLLLKLRGPWAFDGEERFPTLGDMRARVQIGDFEELGRGLVINGTVQLTEVIDPVYTTALVFPPALLAGSRRRWLIVGGGDGATAREALRFRDTESVRLVDISRMVIERTQELIPSFWAECQRDLRLAIDPSDAGKVLEGMADRGEKVDILVYDLSDAGNEETNPFPESSADHLYTEEAFRVAARCVEPGGVFVAQLAELSPVRFGDHLRYREALKKVFRHVLSYRVFLEPFGYSESFVVASNHEGSFSHSPPEPVESRLARIYAGDCSAVYSSRWHEHLFALPPSIARRME